MPDWYAEARKQGDGWEGIKVPPDAETTIATIPKGVATGDAVIQVQFYIDLPSPRPRNIQTRWVRRGPSPNDVTARTAHVVGSRPGRWAGKDTTVENISAGDLPMDFQLWHDAVKRLHVRTVVVKVVVTPEDTP